MCSRFDKNLRVTWSHGYYVINIFCNIKKNNNILEEGMYITEKHSFLVNVNNVYHILPPNFVILIIDILFLFCYVINLLLFSA